MARNAGPISTSNPIAAHPLNAGRVAWWLTLPHTFGGPVCRDLCGRGNAILTNMAASPSASGWRPTTRPGGVGQLLFDGSDDVAVGSTDLSWWTGQLTLACWVNFAATSGQYGLVTRTNSNQPAPWDWYAIPGSGLLRFFASTNIDCSASLSANTWLHLAATASGTQVRQYLNGRDIGGGSATWPSSTPQAIRLGNRGDGTKSLAGSLDGAAVWNRVLSPGEMAALYDQSRRGYPDLLNRRSTRNTVLFGSPAPVGRFRRVDLDGGFPSLSGGF